MFDGYHTLSPAEPRVSAKEDAAFKRTLRLSLAAWLTTSTVWAASDPFVGKWKLDPSQSKETHQMKIEAAGPNRYVFDFGGGGTETIAVDEPQQPGHSGTAVSVTPVEPNTWKFVRRKDGYAVMTAIFRFQRHAKTLTEQMHELPARWVDIEHRLRVHANGRELGFRWQLGKFEREGEIQSTNLEFQPYQGTASRSGFLRDIPPER